MNRYFALINKIHAKCYKIVNVGDVNLRAIIIFLTICLCLSGVWPSNYEL